MAAELILEDESWRNGLDDDQAKALLDEVLAMVDESLLQQASDGEHSEDMPYVLSDEARVMLQDEAWRNGLEDEQAKALLDEALAMVDESLAQQACEGELSEDLPYVLADEARAMLREKAAALLGNEEAPK